jgi:[ribosomal protein S5]-alanine N-acetyltransferase
MTAFHGATLRLETDRLVLLALTAELVEALDDVDAAERMLQATVPEGWPDPELAGLLRIYGPLIAKEPKRLGYGPWAVITRAAVVGSAGFMGQLPEHGEPIELGYGMLPEHRNRGYATEATRALVEWALSQPTVGWVRAKCDPENGASVRVLEKIGMTPCGEADGMLLWEARRSSEHSI